MRKFILVWLLTGSLLFSCCSQATPHQTSSETMATKKESASTTETSQASFTTGDYYKEHKEWIDPATDLTHLLRSFSWYNGSFILTFNDDGTIDAYDYPGSKEKLYKIDYGSYFMNGKNILHLSSLDHPKDGTDFVATIEERKILLSQIDANETGMNLWAMEKFTEIPTEDK